MDDTGEATISEFGLRFECDERSVRQVRARLRGWCQRLYLPDDLLPDVLLAVSEAAANAVRHTGCDYFEVAARLTEESVIVVVSDPGPGDPDAPAGPGYGKDLIRKLATSVDFENIEPGTRVTMRFDRYALRSPGV
jgi:serine/threonine-protein kinase RsbW